MAFPTTPVVDNLNRASLGASWTNDPFHAGSATPTISSNTVLAINGSYSEIWYNAASYANTTGLEAYITIASLASKSSLANLYGHWVGLIQQPSAGTSTADGYQVGAVRLTGTNTDRIQIYKYTNAAPTQLADVALGRDFVATDVIGIEVTLAGVINAYVNGVVIATANDTTYFHAGESAFIEVALVGTGSPTLDDVGGGQTVSGNDTASAGGALARGTNATGVVVQVAAGGALAKGSLASDFSFVIDNASAGGALAKGTTATDVASSVANQSGALARGSSASASTTAVAAGALAKGSGASSSVVAAIGSALARGTSAVRGVVVALAGRALARGIQIGGTAPAVDLSVTLGIEGATSDVGIESATAQVTLESKTTELGLETRTTTVSIDG